MKVAVVCTSLLAVFVIVQGQLLIPQSNQVLQQGVGLKGDAAASPSEDLSQSTGKEGPGADKSFPTGGQQQSEQGSSQQSGILLLPQGSVVQQGLPVPSESQSQPTGKQGPPVGKPLGK